MSALLIIGGILLFFALIFFIPVGIELRYNGDIALDARIAFVRLRLVPKRRKKINLRKFSKKRFEKMLAKEKKKSEKKAAKKSPKQTKKKTASPAEKKKDQKSAEKKTEDKPKLVSDLWQMRSLILKTIGRFIHRINTKTFDIRVIIGSGDAATSAILYGAATQFAVYILEILRTQTRFRCKETVDIGVDFTSEETVAEIALRFSIRVGSVIATAIGFAIGFIKKKLKENKG